MSETAKTVSLESLDICKPCEQGFEFEYISEADSKPSGIFITILGSHAEKVKTWVRRELNRMRQREALMIKKGKDEIRQIEDDEQFAIESAAIRIIGWRGITQDYTPQLAITLCDINPEIRKQVIEKSDELANFIKSK
jgi:hypothetical protein